MRKFWIVPLAASVIAHLFGASPAAAEPAQEAQAAAERTVQELQRVRDNPLALREFLKRMPKGADLHKAPLEYSFLPGASLWASPDYTRFAGACENDGGAEKPSSACEVIAYASHTPSSERRVPPIARQ